MHNLAATNVAPITTPSDMQAMTMKHAFENRVLERLNAGKTVRSFLIATVGAVNGSGQYSALRCSVKTTTR